MCTNTASNSPGAWLPADHRVHHEWMDRQIKHVDANPQKLIPVLQDFKDFIEADPRIYMYFVASTLR